MDWIHDWADKIKTVLEVTALLAAGWWFVYTLQFKRRIQFDLECDTLCLRENTAERIAEIRLIFQNTGFVEHRLYAVRLSVHGLASEDALTVKEGTQELEFTRQVIGLTNIVPKKYGFYFVRPGVRQTITHIVRIPASLSVFRVTASFDYTKNDQWPHTARRVFHVPTLPG